VKNSEDNIMSFVWLIGFILSSLFLDIKTIGKVYEDFMKIIK